MNQTHTEYSIIPDQKDIPSLAFITLLTNTVFIAIMFFLVKLYDQYFGAPHRDRTGEISQKKTLKQTLSVKEFDQFVPKSAYSHTSNKYHLHLCAICLEEFTKDSIIRKIPICEHIFHAKCIEKWFDINETCPGCRQKVTMTEFKELKRIQNNKALSSASNTENQGLAAHKVIAAH